jgi:AcrR family transcriptional regulator
MKHGDRQRAAILAEGLRLWRATGEPASVRLVARGAGLTHGGVLYHFGTAKGLRDALAAEAVASADALIIPHLIVARHPAADSLSPGDRSRYLAGC